MSKVLKCREVGIDCDFEARGATEAEIMSQAAAHAKSVHHIDEIPPELAQKVQAAIHDE
jgi:predicted small metal-binding protein